MGVLVYILGRTGTGKSYSMRNFPKTDLAIINVEGKILPFRNGMQIEQTSTDDNEKIKECLEVYAKRGFKSIIVDDYQYVMSNEFMRRATERGYDKFTDIAAHAWGIADKVRELPSDTIVYIMCHTDTDAEGVERLKTIGKLLDEKIYLEGMSTIVLKTVTSDGKYAFVTQNNGKDTVKSPADMFPAYAIDNDLYYVDQKIREYYGLGATLSNDQLNDLDKTAKQEDISMEKKERRKRQKSEVAEANDAAVANTGIKEAEETGEDTVPFDEVEMPEIKKEPRRKRRGTSDAEVTTTEAKPEEPVQEEAPVVEEAPKRRRRRRDVE